MKLDLEYVVSLFGTQRTYQRALLITLEKLQSMRQFFRTVQATVLVSPEIPLSFKEYVRDSYESVHFRVVDKHLELLLGSVPALWRYTYAFDFPVKLHTPLVRVICDVDSWPTNVVWVHALSRSKRSHFWGTKPQTNRFTYENSQGPLTFSVDCGVAVLKDDLPGARTATLDVISDEDAKGFDYSKPRQEYTHSGKTTAQLSRYNVMFGRDEAVLHQVLWSRFAQNRKLVYHDVESRGQGGRTLEIVLAQPDEELPTLDKVLTRSATNELRYSYPVYGPRPLSELEWDLVKRLEERVALVRSQHSDTVQGCKIRHFAVDGVALAPQLESEELAQLRVSASWWTLVQQSLLCNEPKLVGVEIHYRTKRRTDGKWHRDNQGSLFNWFNVVIPLNTDYSESLGCTQVRVGDATLLLGQCPPPTLLRVRLSAKP